jgi:hypothetical protein
MKVGVGNVFKLVARLLHELARKLNAGASLPSLDNAKKGAQRCQHRSQIPLAGAISIRVPIFTSLRNRIKQSDEFCSRADRNVRPSSSITFLKSNARYTALKLSCCIKFSMC